MSSVMQLACKCAQKFIKNDNGATAIEYGLIGSLLSVAIITGVMSVGTAQTENYEAISTAVDEAINR